jgi:alkanesulfonate monooxygenase SsuD/methylene tetrahydromethanopterin reductase-like flavin-dependent oxidoreductase (luciferase family)
MTTCIVGADHAEFTERARGVYGLGQRDASFDDWLASQREGAILGTVDEVVERLRRLEAHGVDAVMLQHLRHDDLETVALIGRELVPAVA